MHTPVYGWKWSGFQAFDSNNFSTQQFKSNLNLQGVAKATATAENLKLDREALGLSVASEAGKFKMALDSGAMMVKSVKTGEVKTLAIEPGIALKNNVSLSGFEVRDDRVTPKHNFTKADPGMVNIFAHKGPDEAGSSSAGWGRK